jgi:hypothetical protein
MARGRVDFTHGLGRSPSPTEKSPNPIGKSRSRWRRRTGRIDLGEDPGQFLAWILDPSVLR